MSELGSDCTDVVNCNVYNQLSEKSKWGQYAYNKMIETNSQLEKLTKYWSQKLEETSLS